MSQDLFPTTLTGSRTQIRKHLREIVKAKMARTGRLPRAPRQLHPSPAFRAYRMELLAMVDFMRRLAHSKMDDKIMAHAKALDRRAPSRQRDALDDELDPMGDLLSWFKRKTQERYPKGDVAGIVKRTGMQVNSWNKKENQKVLKSMLGIDVLTEESWLAPVMARYVGENVVLIESMQDKYFKEVAQNVYGAFRKGIRAEELAPHLEHMIDDRAGVADSHATLIARDQIGKLNGQLDKERQTELGISKYRWRGALDPRERQSHVDMEGVLCSWNEPPSVDGEPANPGEPIQCRCYAEPAFDFLNE